MAMPSAEAARRRDSQRAAGERERERETKLVLAPAWTVKAIFHLSRYNNLAARQQSLILFSGAERDGVERPGGDGLRKYRSC